MKIEDATCLVCGKCGSIAFNHIKTDHFQEQLIKSERNACIMRVYDEACSILQEGEIECANCASNQKLTEIKEIDLSCLLFEDIEEFFSMDGKERLLFLKKHNISID